MGMVISIHALLAESDLTENAIRIRECNFYPRSPYGERPLRPKTIVLALDISIHALLAESDALPVTAAEIDSVFLSTLSLRRATHYGWSWYDDFTISIHALLAESDSRTVQIRCSVPYFYPRSPCGERQDATTDEVLTNEISIHALLAESDCTLR